MAYTTTTKTSYGKRVKNSAGGIFTGFLLFIAGTVLLFWNEGRTIKTTKMLKEAEGNYVEMADIQTVDPSFEGKLVHAQGFAQPNGEIEVPIFDQKGNYIKIRVSSQYYQWVETSTTKTKDKIGGGQERVTTYDYNPQWTFEPVDSGKFADADFRDSNSVLVEVDDQTIVSDDVSFGAYKLSPTLIDQISNLEPLNIEFSDDVIYDVNSWVLEQLQWDSNPRMVHQASSNVMYIGKDPDNPEIGDVKVTFQKVDPTDVSILAQVEGDSFTSYTAKNGKKLQTLMIGNRSAESMFETQKAGNSMLGWFLRLLGFLLIFWGLSAIFNILVTILKVVPFIANIAGLGIKIACFVVALAWSLIVVSIGWLFYRPVLGAVMLAVAIGLIVWGSINGKKKKALQPEEPEVPVVEEAPAVIESAAEPEKDPLTE